MTFIYLPLFGGSSRLPLVDPDVSSIGRFRIRTFWGDYLSCNNTIGIQYNTVGAPSRPLVRRSGVMENGDDVFEQVEVCGNSGGDAFRHASSAQFLYLASSAAVWTPSAPQPNGAVVRCSASLTTSSLLDVFVAVANPTDVAHIHWAMYPKSVHRLLYSFDLMVNDVVLMRSPLGMYLRSPPERDHLDLAHTPGQWEIFMLDPAPPLLLPSQPAQGEVEAKQRLEKPAAFCLAINNDPNCSVLLLRHVAVIRRSPLVLELHTAGEPSRDFRRVVEQCQSALDLRLIFPSPFAVARKKSRNTSSLAIVNFINRNHIYHGLYVSSGLLVQETLRLTALDAIRKMSLVSPEVSSSLTTVFRKLNPGYVAAEVPVVRQLWEIFANCTDLGIDEWVTEEFVTLPPIGRVKTDQLVPRGWQIFASMRQELIRRFGDAPVSNATPVRYDQRPRLVDEGASRIRGIDPILERATLDLLKKHVGPVVSLPLSKRQGDVSPMTAMSLKDQFHIIRSASHFLCGEGAFLTWLPFARPGSTFVVTFEYFGSFNVDEYVQGNLLYFHYFIQQIRRDVRVIFVLAEHNASLRQTEFRVGVTAAAPRLSSLAYLLRQKSVRVELSESFEDISSPQLESNDQSKEDNFCDVFHVSQFGLMQGKLLPNARLTTEAMRGFIRNHSRITEDVDP